MGRAEMRRSQKDQLKKEKVYTLNQSQIDAIKQEVMTEAIDKAFFLMIALPLEVLLTEDYWKKSAKKRIPKFVNEVLDLYQAWSRDNISLEEMEYDLQEFAGMTMTQVKSRSYKK